MKKYIATSLIIVILGIAASLLFLYFFLPKKSDFTANNNKHNDLTNNEAVQPESFKIDRQGGLQQDHEDNTISEKVDTEANKESIEIPKKILNKSPFVVQAPFGEWDHLHDEACEEASLIIADRYLKKIDSITKQEAENEIQKMVAWQIEDIGSHKDLDVEEMKDLANDYLKIELEIIEDIGLESFRKNLASGKLIIVPLAGQEIGNPYYSPPGPLYHVLVITGYDDSTGEFITHDPGTKHGEDLRYDYETLLNNIHDFPGSKEEIKSGEPKALVVNKK